MAMDEFRSDCRMAKDTTETLCTCRQVQTTAIVPQRQSFGKSTILLQKHFMAAIHLVHYELHEWQELT